MKSITTTAFLSLLALASLVPLASTRPNPERANADGTSEHAKAEYDDPTSFNKYNIFSPFTYHPPSPPLLPHVVLPIGPVPKITIRGKCDTDDDGKPTDQCRVPTVTRCTIANGWCLEHPGADCDCPHP